MKKAAWLCLAPFFFFENLMSLSDNIFIGGYTTHDAVTPNGHSSLEYTFETLEYQGHQYQAKKIKIGNTYNSAVNQYAYHLSRTDLLDFFRERGYELNILTDAPANDPWGDWYLRFLASRKTD